RRAHGSFPRPWPRIAWRLRSISTAPSRCVRSTCGRYGKWGGCGLRPSRDRLAALVGWVERSETHRFAGSCSSGGFRFAQPTLLPLRRDLDLDQLARPGEAFDEFDLAIVERNRRGFGDAGQKRVPVLVLV